MQILASATLWLISTPHHHRNEPSSIQLYEPLKTPFKKPKSKNCKQRRTAFENILSPYNKSHFECSNQKVTNSRPHLRIFLDPLKAYIVYSLSIWHWFPSRKEIIILVLNFVGEIFWSQLFTYQSAHTKGSHQYMNSYISMDSDSRQLKNKSAQITIFGETYTFQGKVIS